MNDKKFFAQLNLYLDGEIDPAGAAALEQEIHSDPARRRIYHDYCRIHRATKLVYEQFRAAGAEHATEARADAQQALAVRPSMDHANLQGGRLGGDRAAARPFRTATFIGGLAAACAVGIFIGGFALSTGPAETSPGTPAIAANEPAATTPVAPTTTASVVKDEPAAFTAPFAVGSRPDPYLVQFPPSRTDPFALTQTTPVDDPRANRLMPVSLSNQLVLKVDPRFQPTGQDFDSRPESRRRQETKSFRLRLDERGTPTPPYEFSVQQ